MTAPTPADQEIYHGRHRLEDRPSAQHPQPEHGFDMPIDLEALKDGPDVLLQREMLEFFADQGRFMDAVDATVKAQDEAVRDLLDWGWQTTRALIFGPEQSVTLAQEGVAEVARQTIDQVTYVRQTYDILAKELEANTGVFDRLPRYYPFSEAERTLSMIEALLDRNKPIKWEDISTLDKLFGLAQEYRLGLYNAGQAAGLDTGRAITGADQTRESTGLLEKRIDNLTKDVDAAAQYPRTEPTIETAQMVIRRGMTTIGNHYTSCREESDRVLQEASTALGALRMTEQRADRVTETVAGIERYLSTMPGATAFEDDVRTLAHQLYALLEEQEHPHPDEARERAANRNASSWLQTVRQSLRRIEDSIEGLSDQRKGAIEVTQKASRQLKEVTHLPLFAHLR